LPDPKVSQAGSRLAMIAPALLGASSFAFADITSKIVFQDGGDVLTAATVRGFIGLAMMYLWLRLRGHSGSFGARAKWISLGLGALFAGNVFLLFKAIETIEVPIAILTYFVYPVLTGLAAAATGLERMTWSGATAALVAFLGLALMIGAHPAGLALIGVLAALAAALCRVTMLLITRANLAGADPLLITWYSLISSSALFLLVSLLTLNWQPPASAYGWAAMLVLGVAITTGILGVFASTVRIGPFRTALFMNLEPPLTVVGSALVLGEVITAVQALGGAIMIAALVAFQLRR
jgi:drug/metabolite transporter (DMT)-like permease